MLINSHNPAGSLRSLASYICHALGVTYTSAAQSLCVRFCAARNALTASALGKAPMGLRFGWLGICRDHPKIFVCSANRSAKLSHKNKCTALFFKGFKQFDAGTIHCGFLNRLNAKVGGGFGHFDSPAPVPRGAVGSVFAAMCRLYMNIVRKSSYFLSVYPTNRKII